MTGAWQDEGQVCRLLNFSKEERDVYGYVFMFIFVWEGVWKILALTCEQ